MLTKGMATDWGKYDIQVNGLGPGYFATEMTKPLVQDPQFDAWLRADACESLGRPDRIVWCSDFSRLFETIANSASLNTAVYTDMDVSTAGTYTYRVQAINASGQSSALSDEITVTL